MTNLEERARLENTSRLIDLLGPYVVSSGLVRSAREIGCSLLGKSRVTQRKGAVRNSASCLKVEPVHGLGVGVAIHCSLQVTVQATRPIPSATASIGPSPISSKESTESCQSNLFKSVSLQAHYQQPIQPTSSSFCSLSSSNLSPDSVFLNSYSPFFGSRSLGLDFFPP